MLTTRTLVHRGAFNTAVSVLFIGWYISLTLSISSTSKLSLCNSSPPIPQTNYSMSYSSAEQQPQQSPSTPIGGFTLMGTENRLPDDVAEAAPAVFIFDGDKETVVTFDIPDGVTEIGNNAFDGCRSLVSINLPDSVTEIGDNAFEDCTSLVSINLPDGVTELGEGAFYGCTSLVSINLPDSVTKIGVRAFGGCTSLVSINLPDGVTEIGNSAFDGCRSLVSINLPDSVTEISSSAFDGCTEIERKATEAGLSTIELGRSNWRKDVAIKRMKIIRYSVVGCISALQHLNFDKLRYHILSNPVEQPAILNAVVCFLVELGEPGVVREIVKFIAWVGLWVIGVEWAEGFDFED
jgi:hypothetical protein